MALAVKVFGVDTIYDAVISAPDANDIVNITGVQKVTNPNLEHANTAAMYSTDIEADFPPKEIPIEINVKSSRIQETLTY